MGMSVGTARMSKMFAIGEDGANSPSQTLLFPHLYPHTPETLAVAQGGDWDDDQYARAQEHIESFYEELFEELQKFGEIEDLAVLDSVSASLQGHVLCKYYEESACARALRGMKNRFYGPRLVEVQFTPFKDFKKLKHVFHIPRAVKRRLAREMYDQYPQYKGPGHPVRSRSPKKRNDEKKKERQSTPERRAMIAEWNKQRQLEAEAQAASAVAVGEAARGQLPPLMAPPPTAPPMVAPGVTPPGVAPPGPVVKA